MDKTNSSMDVIKQNTAAEIIPGFIRGKVMSRNVFKAPAPRFLAALSILMSNRYKVALMIRMTNGQEITVWATTIPMNDPIMCNFA